MVTRTHVENCVLLVETKERATDIEQLAEAKTRARHPAYGRALMLYLDGSRWRVIDFDEDRQRNVLGDDLDLIAAALSI
jgi:hypothetical protein